ncbi:MAG TPA: hypothetical protein VMA32_12260 [Streptosporangiaceae bacterium]|nr:hypothetical protein [Streptosporangiaceae bacterium]
MVGLSGAIRLNWEIGLNWVTPLSHANGQASWFFRLGHANERPQAC